MSLCRLVLRVATYAVNKARKQGILEELSMMLCVATSAVDKARGQGIFE
jgi:hypothetical protein